MGGDISDHESDKKGAECDSHQQRQTLVGHGEGFIGVVSISNSVCS